MRFQGFTIPWTEIEIGKAFQVTRGYVLPATVVRQDASEEYVYPVYSSQTKDDGLMGYYNDYLYENAITWTTDGANAGTVHYRPGKFYCTNVCGVLLSDEGNANRCVAEILGSVSKKYVSYVGNPKLMNNVMSEIKIYVPTIDEQKKIDDFISVIDHRIEKQLELIEHLKKYKRGFLNSVIAQKIHLTSDDEEWVNCSIGDILQILHGKDYKECQDSNGCYPVLGTGGVIDYATKYLCDWPCVLIGRKGTIDKPQYMDKPFWTVDTLFYSKPKYNHNPKFQYYLFQTINWKKYNEASGVPSQSSSTIESIRINVPNIKTQEAIAKQFSKIDIVIEKQILLLKRLQDLKKAFLQQLFI